MNICFTQFINGSRRLILKFDPKIYFDLPLDELKTEIKKTPKFIRTIRSNKAPVLLHSDYASKVEPYSAMTKEQLLERAKLIKSNKDFCGYQKENLFPFPIGKAELNLGVLKYHIVQKEFLDFFA